MAEQGLFDSLFSQLAQPISDYSFANVAIWNTALKLSWTRMHHHVCIFANGDDLTLLLPPMPERGAQPADLRRCLLSSFELMDAVNEQLGDRSRSRVEYISDEMLERINSVLGRPLRLSAAPMSGDYIYPVQNMIDLAGGALKSKRHARSHFMKNYPDHRTENLTAQAVPACLALLDAWRQHADESHAGQITEDESHVLTAVLRERESRACRFALQNKDALDLQGMTLWVGDRLVGFTLGESLSPAQASIIIEKTDPNFNGSAQYIFSEFCRQYWSQHPEINVSDDWGIPSLRFTKESYRPSRRLSKYVLVRPRCMASTKSAPVMTRTTVGAPVTSEPAATESKAILRPVSIADEPAIVVVEHSSFAHDEAFTRRQIHALVRSSRAVCRVATIDGEVAGWCAGLTRRHARGLTGRIYTLAVLPKFRGRGLARKLLDATLAELKERGTRSVYLEVEATNAAALELYARMGFCPVRVLPGYYGEQRPGISMRVTFEPRLQYATHHEHHDVFA
jgi:ribosomal protein S18 acetylase RimI-like enzyme